MQKNYLSWGLTMQVLNVLIGLTLLIQWTWDLLFYAILGSLFVIYNIISLILIVIGLTGGKR